MLGFDGGGGVVVVVVIVIVVVGKQFLIVLMHIFVLKHKKGGLVGPKVRFKKNHNQSNANRFFRGGILKFLNPHVIKGGFKRYLKIK